MNEGNKELLVALSCAAVVGSLTGFGLSFTALAPWIIGGIIGFNSVLSAAVCFLVFIFNDKERVDIKDIVAGSVLAVVGFGVGVGFGIAASALLPGVMSVAWSAALVGAIVAPTSLFMTYVSMQDVINSIAEKINSKVIEPIVERIKEYLPSRENEV